MRRPAGSTPWEMKHCATWTKDVAQICEAPRQSKVLALLQATPDGVQKLADANFALLKQDPHHPSLHFKKASRFWSARVGIHFRAVAVEKGPDLVWFWIGRHDEYESIIEGRQT